MTTTMNPEAETGRPSITWDVNTALAAIVLGALVVLLALSRGFRGYNIGL